MISRFAELVRPLLSAIGQQARTAHLVDVLTVTNAPAASAQATAAVSPATIDAVFGALLQSMADSTAALGGTQPNAVTLFPGLAQTDIASQQSSASQSVLAAPAVSLGAIVTLLQYAPIAAEQPGGQSILGGSTPNSGPLMVPAGDLDGSQDGSAANTPGTAQTGIRTFVPRLTAQQMPATSGETDQNGELDAAAGITNSVPPGSANQTGAPVPPPVDATLPQPASVLAQTVDPQTPVPTVQNDAGQKPAPVRPADDKQAAKSQPKTPLDAAAMAALAASQTASVISAASDDDAPVSNTASEPEATTTDSQQPASDAPVMPAAYFVPPPPAPAAPVATAATADTGTIDTAASKTVQPPSSTDLDAPDSDSADAKAANQPVKTAAHESKAQHPAVTAKPDLAPPPVAKIDPPPQSDATQTTNQAASNAPANPVPHTETQQAAPSHSQPSAPPIADPTLTQTTPSGLRKLTAGLQVAAQEQETTASLDKIGVSIVTKAAEGLRHFTIRMDPPELGRVEVRLSVDDSGKAQASLVVDKSQTLELLKNDSSALNRALSDAGLDLSNNGLNFSLREQHRQNDGSEDQGRGRNLSARTVVQTDVAPIHSSLGSYAPNSVQLDIRV